MRSQAPFFFSTLSSIMEWNWTLFAIVIVVLATAIVVGLTIWGGLEIWPKQGFQNPNPPSIPIFTMFYADWCPHCTTAKPAFAEFMQGGTIDIAGKKVNVEMVQPEKNPEKAEGLPVKGFPTFLLQKPDGNVVEYKGSRDPEGYMKFLNEQLGGGI